MPSALNSLIPWVGYIILQSVDASFLNFPFYGAEYQPIRRTDGDPIAAADLYGIGVRIGIYLQSLGMIIALFVRVGKGYKLTIASNSIGILLSWSILMARKALSFCEAFLILIEVSCFLLPGLFIVVDFETAANEIVGLIGLLVARWWTNAGGLWLFTTYYMHLSRYGTSNAGWAFARVRLDGWFRILVIVLYSISCFLLLAASISVVFLIRFILRYREDESLINGAFKKRFNDNVERIKELSTIVRCVGGMFSFVLWIFSVAACEMIIVWNGLSPETSLTRPGQTIPLTIGIIIAVDGFSSILKHMVFRGGGDD